MQPDLIEDLQARVGVETVETFQALYGGRKRRFPKRPSRNHPLALSLGLEAARAIAQYLDGECVYVPKPATGSRDRLISAARSGGATVADLSRVFGISDRQVQRIVARHQEAAE